MAIFYSLLNIADINAFFGYSKNINPSLKMTANSEKLVELKKESNDFYFTYIVVTKTDLLQLADPDKVNIQEVVNNYIVTIVKE